MMLSQLCQKVGGELKGSDVEFSTVSTDTRTIREGDVFFALRGDSFDGHQFVDTATGKGAVALVLEKPVAENPLSQLIVADAVKALGQAGKISRENFSGTVVAVTGSNGKTTVKGMLASIFSSSGEVSATRGNFNNHIGVPLTLMELSEKSDYAVVEAGTSNAGEIAYLTGLIQPHVALVNNVMAAHLLGFGSRAAIAQEKTAIYKVNSLRAGVINLLDDFYKVHIDSLAGKKTWGFAVASDDHSEIQLRTQFESCVDQLVIASSDDVDSFGRYRFTLCVKQQQFDIQLAVPGRHNIANALAAATCALAVGVSIEDIVTGLQTFNGIPGRMQFVDSPRCQLLVNDTYNANPGSMKVAIDFLSQYPHSCMIVGDMGEIGANEITAHQDVGRYAAECGISCFVGVGKLSRHATEVFGNNAFWFADQVSAVEFLKEQNLKQSVVLVKGSRSARMEIVVNELEVIEPVDMRLESTEGNS